jgi:Secretion system C-terminal sorting domain
MNLPIMTNHYIQGIYTQIAVTALNLPNGIQQQILAAQIGLSPTANALAQINLAQHNIQQVVNEQVSTHFHDTIATNAIDSVITLIKAEGRANPNADLAWAYMLKGDYTAANNYIATLAKYKEFDALAKLMRISLAIAQYTGGIYFKDYQSDYTYVQAMAINNYSPYAPLAQAMLKNYEGATYTTLQLLPTQQASARIANSNSANDSLTVTTITTQDATLQWLIYPNPASNELNIVLKGYSQCNYTIAITDVYGRLIDKLPVITNAPLRYATPLLNNGLYYAKLLCDGVIVNEQKIVINK